MFEYMWLITPAVYCDSYYSVVHSHSLVLLTCCMKPMCKRQEKHQYSLLHNKFNLGLIIVRKHICHIFLNPVYRPWNNGNCCMSYFVLEMGIVFNVFKRNTFHTLAQSLSTTLRNLSAVTTPGLIQYNPTTHNVELCVVQRSHIHE